jgi:hypothetical protein
MIVTPVGCHMLGQVTDSSGKQCDLDLGGASVFFFTGKLINDLRFLGFIQFEFSLMSK